MEGIYMTKPNVTHARQTISQHTQLKAPKTMLPVQHKRTEQQGPVTSTLQFFQTL